MAAAFLKNIGRESSRLPRHRLQEGNQARWLDTGSRQAIGAPPIRWSQVSWQIS